MIHNITKFYGASRNFNVPANDNTLCYKEMYTHKSNYTKTRNLACMPYK